MGASETNPATPPQNNERAATPLASSDRANIEPSGSHCVGTTRPRPPVTAPKRRVPYLRMLMARAMTRAVVDKAMALCNVMSSFAQRVSGIVSVGEKAMALVMLT
jgi:hypothetical protein